ncbi:Planctomycete cytochrome C [Aquisphaera giovannonii]|uniref:Planctomycete cytochrome C n=1 Tax=Aquisphaera giovannonii TaxID=406548 RepID=A0A5B9VZX6_9BACT|nr:PSD1 and planctomycete cytochrome C domain-containing protein [Aquisphaera giovannonii]QEH33551.1 Planctomycete cytochrome C [Aquisphaera giovannonii]
MPELGSPQERTQGIGLRRYVAGLAALTLLGFLASNAEGGDGSKGVLDPARIEFFRSRVEPILKARCVKCHGGEPKVRGGLRLDSRAAILEGGDQGPAVSLDQPDQSLILQAVRYEGLEMPPAGRLPDEEIAALDRWVREGLAWTPGKEATGLDAAKAPPARPNARPRPKVVFHAVERPPVPEVVHSDWVRNPIDAFLLAKLEPQGLAPRPPADRVAWIRRVTYDLTGLPPTPEEVDAYLADGSQDADARLVERLLASPRYGEAWGRHWLDLVRYAETNGYERDGPKPFAWRYRDYVVRSFNDDKPYDRFLHEQIAGDEIDPTSVDAMTATGFYRLGLWDDEPVDRAQARYDGLDGIVSTAGQVFLGLSINCARCHDHKKDPIPQADYYRLLAFFHDLTHPDGKDLKKVGPAPGVPVMCVRERGQAETHVLLRGNPNLLGPVVEPGTPGMLGEGYSTFTRGPGKRRAFAEWLTDRRNPMTARVMANRIWQFHFGRGIVPTPNDFGALGEPATHPELLDWLAAELMDGGWTLKRMHRLILLSSAYRMSSRASEAGLARDPGNLLFWRFPMRRLSGEEVRDSILAVSGSLNEKAGGPSVCPPIPQEVLAGQSVPGQGWAVSPPDEAARRSVYVHVKRSLQLPILATHDAPDTDSSCPVRYTTTVPSQALGLLNGEFANEQASRLAERLVRERPGSLREQVRRAIRLCTGADPPDEEVRGDVAWIRDLERDAHLDADSAMRQFCLLALSTNAFLYLD